MFAGVAANARGLYEINQPKDFGILLSAKEIRVESLEIITRGNKFCSV